MNLKVVPVGVSYIQQTWPLVKHFVEASFTEGHDFPKETWSYNPEHVLQYLVSGSWLLLVALDERGKIHGACTVSFLNYPIHRVAFITAIGGKLISNNSMFEQFKNILKAHGATKVEALCRKSMVRLLGQLGFEPRNTLVEVML